MKNKYIKVILISFGILAVTLLVLLAATELTSRPGFCSNCHFMRPYVEAWKTSTHSEVTCTACHFPPGFKSKIKGKFTALSMVVNYFTGVYKKSKPWAEISDESCLRSGCHAERLLKDDVVFKEGIIFRHRPHLTELRRGKELRCTSCHSQVVQGEHISVTETTCFLCHFKNPPAEKPINDCTWCHDAPVNTKFETVDYDHTVVHDLKIDCKKCHGKMQIGDGAVAKERCSSCHAEIDKIAKYNDVELMHKTHVTDHKVECQQCHATIQHKSAAKTANIVPDCSGCHSNMHAVQYGLFSGQVGQDVDRHPDKMYEAGLTCQACHIFHDDIATSKYTEDTAEPTGATCERCHGEGYNNLFNQWRDVMASKRAIVKKSIEIVEKQLSLNEPPKLKQYIVKPLLDRAKYNYDIVERANIVHNVAFSDQLLTKVSDDLERIIHELNLNVKIPDLSRFSQVIPSECSNCHVAIENLTGEFDGVEFKHAKHIANGQIKCSTCHSNEVKHGEIIISSENCSTCHHENNKRTCESCHRVQAALYQGTATWITDPEADVMFDEDVECIDCHGSDEIPLTDNVAANCESCHDSDYADTEAEWQQDTRQSIARLQKIAKLIRVENLSKSQQNRFKAIQQGLLLIQNDKSQGVHNIELITKTLNQYLADLNAMIQ